MKFHFLGTCSGTEPMKGMHHCSFVVEIDGALYWFDAGENCSYAAVIKGLDIMQTEALFLSHPHIDHVGGLANLFFCFDKFIWTYRKPLANDNRLEVFYPAERALEAAKCLALSEAHSQFRYVLAPHKTMASNYNRIPRPPVVMLKGGESYVAVKRETFEDVCANDI
jgi:ribonuclease BN (tRNA processing enzyme)